MQDNAKKKVLRIEICTGGPYRDASICSVQFYDTTGSLSKVRDLFIKQARAEYVKYKDVGDGPAAEAICKFEFRTLCGYYHFEDGLTFLFPEDSPLFKLVAAGKYTDGALAENLFDLCGEHQDAWHKSKRIAA